MINKPERYGYDWDGDSIATDYIAEDKLHYTLAEAGPRLQAQIDRLERMITDLIKEIHGWPE